MQWAKSGFVVVGQNGAASAPESPLVPLAPLVPLVPLLPLLVPELPLLVPLVPLLVPELPLLVPLVPLLAPLLDAPSAEASPPVAGLEELDEHAIARRVGRAADTTMVEKRMTGS